MVTGDGAYIKRLNRRLILQHIMQHEFISRADIAKLTGLNKATISVQVADLLEANLVTETQHEHRTVGRRPIMLSINGSVGYVLGVDLDYEEITYRISNLQGQLIEKKTTEIDTAEYEAILSILTKEIRQYQEAYSNSQYGLVETVIGVHGTVNNEEWIQFVPRLQWENKDLKEDMKRKIDMSITIENTANLSTFAESVFAYPKSNNLLGIILHSGIGAGIVNDGKLMKGCDGYAGEIGHMIIFPSGKKCKCGNLGCWELYAAEPAVFSQLMEELNQPQLSYHAIRTLLEKENRETKEVMDQFIHFLAIGLNNMINLYNPETIIINSELLKIYPNAIQRLEEQLQSSVSVYRHIVLSDLGNDASVMGACALGIQHFLQVNEVTFPKNKVEL